MGRGDPRAEDQSGRLALARAEQVMSLAWLSLPAEHRHLLESIGASQWRAVDEPLGLAVDGFLRSAGHRPLGRSARLDLESAVAVWIPELRIVLLNTDHEALVGLSQAAYEEFVSRTAWHEWGHALGMTRCTFEDVAAGTRLLDLAPEGVCEGIRLGGYRSTEYTYELVAEVYALLMSRRLRKQHGRPRWCNEEIYALMKRVTGWSG